MSARLSDFQGSTGAPLAAPSTSSLAMSPGAFASSQLTTPTSPADPSYIARLILRNIEQSGQATAAAVAAGSTLVPASAVAPVIPAPTPLVSGASLVQSASGVPETIVRPYTPPVVRSPVPSAVAPVPERQKSPPFAFPTFPATAAPAVAPTFTPVQTPVAPERSASTMDAPDEIPIPGAAPSAFPSIAKLASVVGVPPAPTRSAVQPVLASAASPVPPALKASPQDALPAAVMSTKPYSSYQEAMSATSLDAVLVKYGYVRMETITVDSAGGGKAAYVKCVNLAGDFCFVDVTETPGMSLQLSNQTRVTVSEGKSSVAASVQMSAIDCARTATCGVMFECNGEFCAVKQDDSGSVSSSTFIVSNRNVDARITPYGSPIAFPIVTIAEVMENNESCLARVRKATFEIQKAAATRSIADSAEVSGLAVALAKSLDRLAARYRQVQNQRAAESQAFLRVLTEFRQKQMAAGGMLPSDAQEKIKKIVDHLQGLNRVCIDLLNFVNSFNTIRERLIECNQQTNDAYWSLFLVVRKDTFAVDFSAELRDARTWGLPEALNRVGPEDYMSVLQSETSIEALQLRRLLALVSTTQSR